MINPVEKSFEVEVNHLAVTLGNVALRLGYCLMGRAFRAEAVAVLRERRAPLFLEDLQQGLLDQSVDDARYAEFSDPAVRLGDFDPLDRLRLIGCLEQSRPNAWPVLTQVPLASSMVIPSTPGLPCCFERVSTLFPDSLGYSLH